MPLDQITKVISIPHAYGQCRDFIREHLGNVEHEATDSTAEAVRRVSRVNRPWAAVGTRLAAEMYECHIAAEDIEDAEDNATRFVFVARDAGAAGPRGPVQDEHRLQHRPGRAGQPAAHPQRVRLPARQPRQDRVPAVQEGARALRVLHRHRRKHREPAGLAGAQVPRLQAAVDQGAGVVSGMRDAADTGLGRVDGRHSSARHEACCSSPASVRWSPPSRERGDPPAGRVFRRCTWNASSVRSARRAATTAGCCCSSRRRPCTRSRRARTSGALQRRRRRRPARPRRCVRRAVRRRAGRIRRRRDRGDACAVRCICINPGFEARGVANQLLDWVEGLAIERRLARLVACVLVGHAVAAPVPRPRLHRPDTGRRTARSRKTPAGGGLRPPVRATLHRRP